MLEAKLLECQNLSFIVTLLYLRCDQMSKLKVAQMFPKMAQKVASAVLA